MSEAQVLQEAGRRMLQSNKTERSVTRRVIDIAARMAKGQATDEDIAWAKRNAKSFMRRQAM